MPNSFFWPIYKLFHDPPGTPKDVRCITCKYIAAGGAFTLSAASLYGVKRTIANNAYIGFGWIFATLFTGGVGAVALRMSVEDKKWNRDYLRETAEEIKKQRRLQSGKLAPENANLQAT